MDCGGGLHWNRTSDVMYGRYNASAFQEFYTLAYLEYTGWRKVDAAIPSGKTIPSLGNARQGIGDGVHKYAGPKQGSLYEENKGAYSSQELTHHPIADINSPLCQPHKTAGILHQAQPAHFPKNVAIHLFYPTSKFFPKFRL